MPKEHDDAQYYRDVLDELIDAGTVMARRAQAAAEAAAQSSAASAVDHAAAFERIAAAIRRTIALRRALDEPARAREILERSAARAKPVSDDEDGLDDEDALDLHAPRRLH